MNIEIVDRKENALLERVEVRFRVLHENAATPKRDEVREKLAGLLSTKKNNVVVDSMASSFGKQVTSGYARVYPSTEKMGKLEEASLLKRNGLSEFAPKKKERTQAAPAETKKAAPKRR